ncbi:hypothetical protein CAPTEDRAFT_227419 [Capitella teleta]|uniref:Protein arginine N-methyltransferase 6 n=1 Tax=Capitella teleta TaxID=283909 RepID=R7TAN7_CAPTE|nr:hypothetical protein CAPTEDRAFT_227419 [Capitella teleta]|eukprot:ELT88074.1 hypothetical protein CAPTEDRAFT_227419 [Capitella teleta]
MSQQPMKLRDQLLLHDHTMEANKRRIDDSDYFRSYSDVSVHELMLNDDRRTRTYQMAIMRGYKYFYGKVVADVGAGTGVLSMFCVHAGAKKVFAIEASEMADQISEITKANDMQDKITVLYGKAEEVELPEKVDVIVSEWMGYFLLYESMLNSVLFVRDKWLKKLCLTKDGVMFPSHASLYTAPLASHEEFKERLDFWDCVGRPYKLNFSPMKSYARKCFTKHIHVTSVDPSTVVSRPAKLCKLDLLQLKASVLDDLQAEFCLKSFGSCEIDSLAFWFDVEFPGNVQLSTSPDCQPSHWQQSVIYLKESLKVEQDTDIKGRISVRPCAQFSRNLDVSLQYGIQDKVYNQRVLMDDLGS